MNNKKNAHVQLCTAMHPKITKAHIKLGRLQHLPKSKQKKKEMDENKKNPFSSEAQTFSINSTSDHFHITSIPEDSDPENCFRANANTHTSNFGR